MNREVLNSKKEMILEFVNSKSYKPMSTKEMGVVLQVPAKEKKDFRAVLDELYSEGKIQLDLKGKIKPLSEDIFVGKFMGTQRGFGFVRVEGDDEDIFIPAHKTRGAIDGDTVHVVIDEKAHGKRREGEVISIVERGTDILVGTYSKSKSFGFVVPDNQKFGRDIYIPKAESKGAITGHKVVVEITDYGSDTTNPEGKILEIIGHINDPGVDILSIIKAYGLPEEYPDEVMDQVEKIEDEVAEEEKNGRSDYRNLQMVTIDGEDAKDLDDAVSLTKENGIYHLGVHIADVSNYVTECSPLDKEAVKRGTSVYLVDRVIPMLPHKLSNGICSLNQGVDRLALSCMMDINEKGEIVKHSIEESVINVDRRMSYTSVHKIVELEDEEEQEKYKELIPMFELMYELAGILRERRFKRGSIDFDFPESKIILDEKGKPVEIKEYERNNANRIIEEFMLAANQTVAEEYFWQELPFVYRVHEEPDEEKINKLGVFIENFGYTLKVNSDGEIHPKEIQKLIKSVEGKPEEALISRLALRSMKQAKYMTQCGGHFGLSMKYYCHFTSPIRRYPDLQIHRIIKENIHGQMNDKRIGHYNQILPEVAEAASRLERRADDAEREVEKLKKAEYMEQFIGQSFDGIISGVTTWGMYVELPNTVEGMVRVADIPGDYYYFEEEKYRMVGEHTGKSYKLGEPIRITVSAVDKLTKTIDFTVCEDYELSDGDSENADGNIGDKTIKNKESDNSSLVSGDEKEPESRENERKSSKSQSRRVVEKSDSESLRSSEREKTAKGKKRINVEKSDSSANGHRRKTSKSSESRSRRDSERKSKAVSKPKNKAAARAKQKAVMEAKEKALKAFEYRKKKAKKKAAKAAAEAKIEHEVKKLTGAAKKRALNKAKKKAKKKAKQAKKLKK